MLYIDLSFKLNITIENGYELCRGSLQYGYVLQLKVSFKMGLFSDTKHTHPGIFILESPPRGSDSICPRAFHTARAHSRGRGLRSEQLTKPLRYRVVVSTALSCG